MFVVIVWIGFSIFVAGLASQRNRSAFGFFVLSLAISPLLAGLCLLVQQEKLPGGGMHVPVLQGEDQVRCSSVPHVSSRREAARAAQAGAHQLQARHRRHVVPDREQRVATRNCSMVLTRFNFSVKFRFATSLPNSLMIPVGILSSLTTSSSLRRH
jgi:hypothetical protein